MLTHITNYKIRFFGVLKYEMCFKRDVVLFVDLRKDNFSSKRQKSPLQFRLLMYLKSNFTLGQFYFQSSYDPTLRYANGIE